MNLRLNLINLQMQQLQEETKKELKRAPMINKVPKFNLRYVVSTQDEEETKAEPQQAQQA